MCIIRRLDPLQVRPSERREKERRKWSRAPSIGLSLLPKVANAVTSRGDRRTGPPDFKPHQLPSEGWEEIADKWAFFRKGQSSRKRTRRFRLALGGTMTFVPAWSPEERRRRPPGSVRRLRPVTKDVWTGARSLSSAPYKGSKLPRHRTIVLDGKGRCGTRKEPGATFNLRAKAALRSCFHPAPKV